MLETAIAVNNEKQRTDSDTRSVDIGLEDNDAFLLENAVETDPIATFASRELASYHYASSSAPLCVHLLIHC